MCIHVDLFSDETRVHLFLPPGYMTDFFAVNTSLDWFKWTGNLLGSAVFFAATLWIWAKIAHVLVCTPEILIHPKWLRRWAKAKDPKTPDSIVDAFIASFKTETGLWFHDGGGYTLTHMKTGVELWMSNGVHHLRVYRPVCVQFTAEQRLRLWEAYLQYIPASGDGSQAFQVLSKFSSPDLD